MIRRLPLVPVVCLAVVALATACSSGGAGMVSTANSTGAGATATDPNFEPSLNMPVSRFAVSLTEVGTQAFLTDVNHTYNLTVKSYGNGQSFSSAAQGEKLLREWGYVGGYETGYEPNGGLEAVLSGAYYIQTEVHLFRTVAGAKAAFKYFSESSLKSSARKTVTISAVGNQSIAYEVIGGIAGKVGGTTVNAAYDQVIFRRGNVVAIDFTYGAQGFMNISFAHRLAVMEDEKMLGKIQAPVPTPTSNFTPPANQVPQSTPTPAGG